MSRSHAILVGALVFAVAGCLRLRPAPATVDPTPVAARLATASSSLADLSFVPPETSALASRTPTPPPRRYTVQAGDVLWVIAERFGVSPEAIVKASKLDQPEKLAVGDVLIVPSAEAADGRAAPATPTPAPRRYTVQEGDTLWSIAERFGVSPQEIVKASKLVRPERLAIGDKLVVPVTEREGAPASAPRATPTPTPEPRRYTVQAGDTLWSIAERFGVGIDALRAANPALSPDRLGLGQAVVVPATPPTAGRR